MSWASPETVNPYSANVENKVSSYNTSKWQMGFNSAFKGLTFKNRASYIQDGRIATLQMLHFIYIFFQQI